MPTDTRMINEWIGGRASHLLDFKDPKIPRERLRLAAALDTGCLLL